MAEHRVLLEIWKEDAEELRDTLQKASQNGVKILIVSYREIDFDFAQVYKHGMSHQKETLSKIIDLINAKYSLANTLGYI